MAQRAITAADLFRYRSISDPQISPDGQHIAYVVTRVKPDHDGYQSAIWWVPARAGAAAARPFTADGRQPRWSPDGAYLAFVTDRAGPPPDLAAGEDEGARDQRVGKGKPQIWLLPTAGGEARQLTFQRNGAGNPTWSPDGQTLCFEAGVGEIPETPKHDGKAEPRARRITIMTYRFNGAGFIYELRTHLFTVPVAGGAARQITDGDWNDDGAAWSPDGQRIAFSSNRGPDRWREPSEAIYVVAATGGEATELLSAADMRYGNPSWAPAGDQLACLGEPRYGGGGHTDVYVFRPGEPPRLLTGEPFQTFTDAIGSDMRNDHGNPTPRWSADGQTLFALGNERGAGNVLTLAVADGALGHVTSGEHHVTSFSVDRASAAVAFVQADALQPGDLYVLWRASGATARLTDSNAELLGEVTVSAPTRFDFTGADGWAMEGWYITPPGFEPGRRYPLILQIHGGPNTSYGWTYVHEFQLLAAQGFIVAYTNIRGSTSYGRGFSQGVQGVWGEADYQDLMAATDALIATGHVDPARLGVIGGSYGGVMTNWIVSHTDRFRAAVTDRSICNFASFFGTSDIGPWLSKENWEVPPWVDPKRYADHSAITFVEQIHTPLLLIHSEDDLRCPIEQADQLFAALMWLGREAEYLRFEGQNHDLSRNGHPRLRVERLDAIVDWFTRHIPTTTA